MYRVIAITAAGLVLAACSSDTSTKNLFAFEPAKDTIRFESEPAGADAKTSTGQTCRTPCALAMPADKAFTVAFTLAGYQPTNEEVKLTAMGDGSSQLRPNPVLVELTPAPPPKPKKKVRRKRTAAKPDAEAEAGCSQASAGRAACTAANDAGAATAGDVALAVRPAAAIALALQRSHICVDGPKRPFAAPFPRAAIGWTP